MKNKKRNWTKWCFTFWQQLGDLVSGLWARKKINPPQSKLDYPWSRRWFRWLPINTMGYFKILKPCAAIFFFFFVCFWYCCFQCDIIKIWKLLSHCSLVMNFQKISSIFWKFMNQHLTRFEQFGPQKAFLLFHGFVILPLARIEILFSPLIYSSGFTLPADSLSLAINPLYQILLSFSSQRKKTHPSLFCFSWSHCEMGSKVATHMMSVREHAVADVFAHYCEFG